MKQRDNSHDWKCQPEKFLPTELEIHELIFGTLSLFVCSSVTGCIAWYAANDGRYMTIYYEPDEYGWLWFFLQIPVVFVYQVMNDRGDDWHPNVLPEKTFSLQLLYRIMPLIWHIDCIIIHFYIETFTKCITNTNNRQHFQLQPYIRWN